MAPDTNCKECITVVTHWPTSEDAEKPSHPCRRCPMATCGSDMQCCLGNLPLVIIAGVVAVTIVVSLVAFVVCTRCAAQRDSSTAASTMGDHELETITVPSAQQPSETARPHETPGGDEAAIAAGFSGPPIAATAPAMPSGYTVFHRHDPDVPTTAAPPLPPQYRPCTPTEADGPIAGGARAAMQGHGGCDGSLIASNTAPLQRETLSPSHVDLTAWDSTEQQPPGAPLCSVCLALPTSHAVVPCGHECLCSECAQTVQQRNVSGCPVCRGRIQMIIRIFR